MESISTIADLRYKYNETGIECLDLGNTELNSGVYEVYNGFPILYDNFEETLVSVSTPVSGLMRILPKRGGALRSINSVMTGSLLLACLNTNPK